MDAPGPVSSFPQVKAQIPDLDPSSFGGAAAPGFSLITQMCADVTEARSRLAGSFRPVFRTTCFSFTLQNVAGTCTYMHTDVSLSLSRPCWPREEHSELSAPEDEWMSSADGGEAAQTGGAASFLCLFWVELVGYLNDSFRDEDTEKHLRSWFYRTSCCLWAISLPWHAFELPLSFSPGLNGKTTSFTNQTARRKSA